MAPFSSVIPSAGWSTVNKGASIWANGTVMTTWAVWSGCLPVSGSVASILNWFLPRRRSTSTLQAPVESADAWREPPAASTVTVPPGIVVPLRTYEAVPSSTVIVATAGVVTVIVGGLL